MGGWRQEARFEAQLYVQNHVSRGSKSVRLERIRGVISQAEQRLSLPREVRGSIAGVLPHYVKNDDFLAEYVSELKQILYKIENNEPF